MIDYPAFTLRHKLKKRNSCIIVLLEMNKTKHITQSGLNGVQELKLNNRI
jgi:hypothetical protein